MSKELFISFKSYKENSDSNNLYNLNLHIFNNYDFIKSLKKTDKTHEFINSKKIKINDKEFDDDDIDKLPDIKDILAIKIDEKNNDKNKTNIFYLFIKFIDKLQFFLQKNNEAFNKIHDFHKKHNDNIKDIITTINEFSKPSLKKNTEEQINEAKGNAEREAKELEGNAEEELKKAKGNAEKELKEGKEKAERQAKELEENAKNKAKEAKEKAERQAKELEENAKNKAEEARKKLEKISPDKIGKGAQNQLNGLGEGLTNFLSKGGNDEEEEIMINIKNKDEKIIEELNYKYNEIFNYYKEIKNNINISSDFIKVIKIVIGKSGLNLADPIEKDEIRYEGLKVYFKRYNKDDKNKYKKELESLSDIFDNKWDDIIKDKQIEEKYKKKIKQIKIDYNNITTFLKQNYLNKDIDEILEDKKDVSILNENVSLVSKIYYGKNNPIEKLKLIEKKVKNNDKLTEDEINFFKNFDIELNTIYEEKKNKLEGNENELKKLDDSYKKAIELYERLKNSDFAQKIEEIVNSGNFKKKNEIYWEDYIFIFRIFLTLFIYYCIITIIFILFISILGFLILIYDLIKNLIILFINKNNGYDINVNTLDYRFKKIINCTKDNFSNDRFLILNGQKQNIIIFNTCSYIMYLIIFYIMLYILVIIYSKIMEKQLVGNVDLLDPKMPFIILGIVFFIYSLIHLMFYKYVFRNLVFRPYKRLNEEEKEIDKIIDNYILIIGSEGEDENDKILIDNNFFELLFDASRIDELNNFFFMEINNKDPKKCLIQKIIIYNLYNYFNDYLIFDEDTQELFKKYCSNNYENKPLFNSDDSDPDGLKTTFISLINRSETKLIRKYHEELPYNDNISDENLEFYNKINKQVDKAINEINGKIITYNKTSLPFIITIIYLIILIIFNMAVVYLVVSLITSPTDKNPFNNYIVRLCEKLNEYIFNPIIQMFSNKLN